MRWCSAAASKNRICAAPASNRAYFNCSSRSRDWQRRRAAVARLRLQIVGVGRVKIMFDGVGVIAKQGQFGGLRDKQAIGFGEQTSQRQHTQSHGNGVV